VLIMKATIDRIEGPMAVLITREDVPVVFNLPASFLGDAREGDIVDIAITPEPEATKATRERVTSLIEKLKQKSGPG
jgi:hypothetical protein